MSLTAGFFGVSDPKRVQGQVTACVRTPGCAWTLLLSSAARARIDVAPFPYAVPVYDQEVVPDSVVTLHGTASDPDGDPLTYAWTQVDGPPAVIRDPDDPETVVDGFEAGATLTFRLTVTDAQGASSSDEVIVTVSPK